MGKNKRTIKDNFSETVKMLLAEATAGRCWYDSCINEINDFHHRLPNRPENRARFPLFIQSAFNCIPLCRGDHQHNSHEYHLTDKQAEAYEIYLRKLKEG